MAGRGTQSNGMIGDFGDHYGEEQQQFASAAVEQGMQNILPASPLMLRFSL